MRALLPAALVSFALGAVACPGPEPQAGPNGAGAAVGAGATATGGDATGGGGAGTGSISSASNGGSSAGGGGAGGSSGGAPNACELAGFSTSAIDPFVPEFVDPQSPDFALYYTNQAQLACIEFVIECTGGGATSMGQGAIGCPDPPYCWGANISACQPGPATVRFLKEKGIGLGIECEDAYRGAPGVEAASCVFTVQ